MEDLAEPRWPPGLAMMKTIDDLLRCGICFEYFNIAVIIPQCSHNYCSLCIRKFLSYKTQCPTCCVAVTEPDLRNNRLLDELVKSMSFARTRLLQFALESPPISPVSSTSKKVVVKVHNVEATQHPVKQGNRLMDKFLIRETGDCVSELLGKENERKFSPQKEISTSADIKETSLLGKTALGLSDANGPVTPSTSTLKLDTKVSCPVCGVSIPENHINKHLDSCLSREEKKESLRSSAHKRKPLPKTVYNLLSDRDLKKKLKQHGLSIQGNKQQLIKRHQEFVHMYNAQCDALHPKSAAEIVQEIENMEKTRMRLEASKLNENVMVFTKNQTEKEIEEIHSKYRKKHQNEFQLLVDQAKKGYKKTGRMSKAAVMRKDEPAETLPSERMAQEDNVSFSDTVSVTKHFPQSKVDSPGLSEPERPDDSSSCTDILLSSESDSCNRNDQNKEVSPQQNRRTRATERAEIEPRNKRNKN
ncbi:E3 ubiquitin-protein ligase RAD18 isoform X2 [Rattus norvegicus]|uniref:E3 ubiquitin-protein ligase RAD18 n=1 Tax=Rattus norvegicus TaxID=10116 RepID=A0A8I6GKR5_RAT|nr:E3 ubiquitin-protein ligase RAD18 isoform X2 [Rattus norvegicus]|eukprot:XP_006237099.1 PREDICTED: E3 ubiquitin-protein ligase RAD18 isoform X2 [Rattus norvegicus]